MKRQRLLEELNELERKLNVYTEARVTYEKFSRSFARWKCWMVAIFVLLACQFGATIYDSTLPSYQNLFLPWVGCWVLAFIGQQMPEREMRAIRRAQIAKAQQQHDDYYKAVTGVDRG